MDANLANQLPLSAESGSELPLSSGFTRLQPPADELVVSLESLMPTVIAGLTEEIPVATIQFTNTADAGHYALELSELVRTSDWQEQGLPPTFDMRIGLHCGPVFCCQDPITKLPLYTGPHTSRTARIEPITPPGQVYASSAFAAVAAATGVDDLKFSYIGRTQLAKKYGSLALYHVQRP